MDRALRRTVLTAHERKLLAHIASGESLREAARRESGSYSAAQKTSGTIKRKLGALSLPHAVALALRAGFLEMGDGTTVVPVILRDRQLQPELSRPALW